MSALGTNCNLVGEAEGASHAFRFFGRGTPKSSLNSIKLQE